MTTYKLKLMVQKLEEPENRVFYVDTAIDDHVLFDMDKRLAEQVLGSLFISSIREADRAKFDEKSDK